MMGDPSDPSQAAMTRFAYLVQHSFRTMIYMPMAFITAKTGKNVKALLNLSQSLYKQSHRRVSTGTLNRVLREAVDAHPPASRENRTPRIYYATQVDVAPPTIVLFVNSTRLFDQTYQRYLLNIFRQKLPFRDIPIKLYMRDEDRPSRAVARRRKGPIRPRFVDSDRIGITAEPRVTAHAGGSDPSLRFINYEVNELLADLDD